MLPSLNPNLAEQVRRALHCCLHRSMPRLEARHYISFYEKDPSRDELLLRFAKVDYNLLQLLHKQEIYDVSRLEINKNRLREREVMIVKIYIKPKNIRTTEALLLCFVLFSSRSFLLDLTQTD